VVFLPAAIISRKGHRKAVHEGQDPGQVKYWPLVRDLLKVPNVVISKDQGFWTKELDFEGSFTAARQMFDSSYDSRTGDHL
jgi:hypothetical protein